MAKSVTQAPNFKAAATSIACFHQITQSGQIIRENDLIQDLLSKHQPLSSRQLTYMTQKERGNVTRSIRVLELAGKVKVDHYAKCTYTNKTVGFYCLDNSQGVQP